MKTKKILISCFGGLGIYAAGYFTCKKFNKPKNVYAGNLRIDESEQNEAPKLFLELTTDFMDIYKSDEITLKVVKKNYI